MTEPTDNRKPDIIDLPPKPDASPEVMTLEQLQARLEENAETNRQVVSGQLDNVLEQAQQQLATEDESGAAEIEKMISESIAELEQLEDEERSALDDVDEALDQLAKMPDQDVLLIEEDETKTVAVDSEDSAEITALEIGEADLAMVEILELDREATELQRAKEELQKKADYSRLDEAGRERVWQEIADIGPDYRGAGARAAKLIAAHPQEAPRLKEANFTPEQIFEVINSAVNLNPVIDYQKYEQDLGLTKDQTKMLFQTADRVIQANLNWRLITDRLAEDERIDGETTQNIIDTIVENPNSIGKLDQIGLSPEKKREVGLVLLERKPLMFLSVSQKIEFNLTKEQQVAAMSKFVDLAKELNRSDIYGTACFATGMSNEQIDQFLGTLPADKKLDMMRAMALASPERAYDAGKLEQWTAERAAQNPEVTAHIERSRKIEQELNAALERADGPNADMVAQNRAAELRLANGKMTAFEELVDVNDPAQAEAAKSKPLRLFVEGSNLPNICKPAVRDLGTEFVPESQKPGSSMWREWLTYQVAKCTGIDRVPPTVIRNTPFGQAAVQEWRVSHGMKNDRWLDRANTEPKFREELKILGALDVIMRQLDRHAGNWSEAPDGNVVIYDSGLCAMRPPENQAEQEAVPFNMMRCQALWAIEDEELPEELKESFTQLKIDRESAVGKLLSQCFETALGEDAQRAEDYMWAQIDQLLENGYPPSEFDQTPSEQFREWEDDVRKAAL